MGTNFTDLVNTDVITAANINSRLEELGVAIDAGLSLVAIDLPITAGETLAIRDAVYIASGVGGDTAGRAYKADASNTYQSSQGFVIGFATSAIASGSTGEARAVGITPGFTGLTAGAPQFVSETAGEVVEVEPANSWLMGIAISTTEIMVNSRGDQGTVATS